MKGVFQIIIQNVGNDNLYVRYRDSKRNLITDIVQCKPYFWGKNDTIYGSIINYDGKVLYKTFFDKSPDDQKNFNTGYEIDVSLENRYLIDNYETLPEYEPRIVHFDIETAMSLDTLRAPVPITAITLHDSYTDHYYTFTWKENIDTLLNNLYSNFHVQFYRSDYLKMFKTNEKDNWTIYLCSSEQYMYKSFCDKIQELDPDIMTGWNILHYDIPYIINRGNRINCQPEKLSPINKLDKFLNDHTKDPIKGRIVFDLKFGYEKLIDGDSGYTALRSVLEDNNAPIQKLSGLDSYESDFENFLRYNLRDVEGTVWIDKRFGIIETFMERQKLVGCKFTDTYYNKDMVDCTFLRKANREKIALPSQREQIEEETYEGATIYKPVKGFHKNVVTLDVASMYPSSMIASNMSFETIVKNVDGIDPNHLVQLGNGVTFRRDFEGFTTSLLNEIQEYRDLNKKKMKGYPEGSIEYMKYDNIQRVAKFLKNSMYGVFAYKSFRCYDVNIAKSITWLSRQAIAHIRETVEKNYPDCKVLYGHTDSVFVKVPDISMAKELENTVNSSWGEFENKFNLIPNNYRIEVDKIFDSLLLTGPNMYAGKIKGKTMIKGFAAKKKSTSPIIKNLQGTVIDMILEQRAEEEIFAFIKNIINSIRNGTCSINDMAIKTKLKQPLNSYKTSPMHVSSARWANDHMGLNLVNIGDLVKMVAVKDDYLAKVRLVPKNGVIAFDDENVLYQYNIDYESMLTRLVPGKLKLIFEAQNWDLEEMMKKE